MSPSYLSDTEEDSDHVESDFPGTPYSLSHRAMEELAQGIHNAAFSQDNNHAEHRASPEADDGSPDSDEGDLSPTSSSSDDDETSWEAEWTAFRESYANHTSAFWSGEDEFYEQGILDGADDPERRPPVTIVYNCGRFYNSLSTIGEEDPHDMDDYLETLTLDDMAEQNVNVDTDASVVQFDASPVTINRGRSTQPRPQPTAPQPRSTPPPPPSTPPTRRPRWRNQIRYAEDGGLEMLKLSLENLQRQRNAAKEQAGEEPVG